MENNMKYYDVARVCPENAQRQIQAGKLKGKTDINPMWRIKQLTEMFGPCGLGWRTRNETFWTTPGANGEVVAWCSIQLQYFDNEIGEWSDPVFGIGGSMLVDTQKGNLASNDEAYKMAYTDAISVCCKALGFAADIYWQADTTKYGRNETRDPAPPKKPAIPRCDCDRCKKEIFPKKHGGRVYTVAEIVANSQNAFGANLCWGCMKELRAEQAGEADAAGF